MKKGNYPWPTDAVTKRQLDRANDLAKQRYDRQARKMDALTVRMRTAEADLTRLGLLIRSAVGIIVDTGDE